ncbi:unnamed protein product [Parascedosporium putredinis]|uniref:Uncharacterized protein n=1 Tax=Parascedosporium putredinis TaxID=1442378 RepID=A0A9P1GZI7_9PEZI|nr:unnamed protein product [Parascedosporium putredinis]CAI7991717.1 unnamed protein product [Parascedosporium putredinis]
MPRPGKAQTTVSVRALDRDRDSPVEIAAEEGKLSAALPWRPRYLRWPVLVSFALAFATLIAVAQALLNYSNKNGGLGSPRRYTHYFWQYGGTVVITLLLATWTRVEYQAKSTTPWRRLFKGPIRAEQSLLLDYASDLRIVAIFKALANGDFLVAITASITILFWLLVLVATALISPAFIGILKPSTPITLQTVFTETNAGLQSLGPAPFLSMVGVALTDLSFPDCISDTIAYQSFTANLPASARLDVVVDGFTSALDCEPAGITLDSLRYVSSGAYAVIGLTVATASCSIRIEVATSALANTLQGHSSTYILSFQPGSCGGSGSPDDQRVAVIFPEIDIDHDSSSVNDDAEVRIYLTLYPGPIGDELETIGTTKGATSRQLANVNVADLIGAHTRSYQSVDQNGVSNGPYSDPAQLVGSNTFIDANLPMLAALNYKARRSSAAPSLSNLEDSNFLSKMVDEYFQQYMVFIAREGLWSRPQSLPQGWLRSSAIGLSKTLLQALRGTGAADAQVLQDRLKDSTYSVGVEPYERKTEDGLGYFKIYASNPTDAGGPAPVGKADGGGFVDIRDDGVCHMLWTTAGPALLLGLVAVYISAADFSLKGLLPYANLAKGGSFEQSVALDLLDKSLPRILRTSFATRSFTALSSALAVVFAATLAIFSGTLFSAVSVPLSQDLAIPTVDFFPSALADSSNVAPVSCATCSSAADALTASLILAANFSYPRFTFENLVFQTLGLEAPPEEVSLLDQETDEANDPEELIASVVLPAIRPKMSCRLFAFTELDLNLTAGDYRIQGRRNPLRIDVPGERCFDGKGGDEVSNALLSTIPNSGTIASGDLQFGLSLSARDVTQCSDWLYIWGNLADPGTNDTSVTSAGALACNETVEVVDTTVNFHGRMFEISPSDPPITDESTARESPMELETLAYESLVKISSDDLLDPFFSLLVNSRYAIPADALSTEGDTAMQVVADGIIEHHGIFRAQSINSKRRASVLSNSQRDPITTRVLQAVLSAMIALSIISWMLTPSFKMAHSPHSIASTVSFLADGNIFGFLPRGAEWMSESDLKLASWAPAAPRASS